MAGTWKWGLLLTAVARERSGVACGGEEIPREKEKEI
jgi:hypothetical protein